MDINKWKRCHRIEPVVSGDLKTEFIQVHPACNLRIIHILPFLATLKLQGQKNNVNKNAESTLPKKTNNFYRRNFSETLTKPNIIKEKYCHGASKNWRNHTHAYLLDYAEALTNTIIADVLLSLSIKSNSQIIFKMYSRHSLILNSTDSLKAYLKQNSVLKSRRTLYAFTSVRGYKKSNTRRKLTSIIANKVKPIQRQISSRNVHCERGTLSKRLNTLLFFIHGLGGSADVWKSQLAAFSCKGYEVLAVDLLGHGLSSAPDINTMYVFSEMLKDVLFLFDCYAKQRNVIIGHSYGCAFASAITEKRLFSVKQLILISGGGPKALEPRHGLPLLFPLCGLSILKCFACHRKYSKWKEASHLAELSKISAVPWYVLKHILKGQKWPEGTRHFYRNITCPTLLVYGLKDNFISLKDELEMEKTLPQAQLEVIPQAGHSVMLDAPDKLNDIIYQFISSVKK